jgi:hypothetical protein
MFAWTYLAVLLSAAAQASAGAALQSDELIGPLAKIRLDRNQVYSVREIAIRRDVFSISLNRGTLAFTESLAGKVTGAVFIGSGEILAVPPGRIEKQQLFRFTKSALLNERFEAAVFRFTDETHAEILREIRGRAVEDVTPEEVDEILRWDSELQRRSRFLNGRILADLLGPPGKPLFLAQLEGRQLGWFDAVYDERRSEEVLIEQHTSFSPQPVIWVNFDKRSEQQSPVSPEVQDKSVVQLTAYETAESSATLTLRVKEEGERVLDVPVPLSSDILAVTLRTEDGDTALPFLEGGFNVSVVLPKPSSRGDELKLQFTYSTAPPSAAGFSHARPGTVMPESYRDQWIIDGIANYAGFLGSGLLPVARSQLLEQSPQGGTYDSLGPISVGFRMTQLSTTPAAAAALRNKSVWVIHMLRMLMRRGDNDGAFAEMIMELQSQFEGRTISTSEFRKLAEKYAGQELDWFFEQWVQGTGIPTYGLVHNVTNAENGFVIQGRISQTGVPEGFTMPVPVFADDVLLGNVPVSDGETEFRFMTRTKPATVRIDPYQTILAVISEP